MKRSYRRLTAVVGVASLGALAAGFGAAAPGASASTPVPAAAAGSYSLKGVCPSTIVTQTDWNPEADHSELYELAAPGGTVDNNKKTYTSELISHGHDTGVKIQIRIGGPAIGYNSIDAQMYTDTSILLGYVSTDGQIQDSSTQPTIALVAPRQTSPLILMWDPKQHPTFKTIADIGKSGIKVLTESGQAYVTYLTSTGLLKSSQIDASYDSTPSRWVAAGGNIAQQGFATAEPYEYSHEITQWDKPVKYALIASTGYDPYPEALATIPSNVPKYAACFKKLIPDIQQAQVDYAEKPGPANALIVKLVTDYNNGWVYDAGAAAYSVKTQLADKIIANGSDGVMGSFNMARITKLIKVLTPIYTKTGKAPKSGLTAAALATNQFIDSSIKLPAAVNG